MTADDPTPIPVRIYPLAEVERLFTFPSNTGKGQVVGVIGWGPRGKIGIDTSTRPNVEIVLIGEQVNGTTSGELMMDTAIVRGFLPHVTHKLYLSLADGYSIAEAIATATRECNVTTCSFGDAFCSPRHPTSTTAAMARTISMTVHFMPPPPPAPDSSCRRCR